MCCMAAREALVSDSYKIVQVLASIMELIFAIALLAALIVFLMRLQKKQERGFRFAKDNQADPNTNEDPARFQFVYVN